MRLALGLEVLAAVDEVVLRLAQQVALAEQRAPRSLAGLRIADVETACMRVVRLEGLVGGVALLLRGGAAAGQQRHGQQGRDQGTTATDGRAMRRCGTWAKC
ncbi:hypothetical protein LRS14_17800 [Aquincola sp. J276]|nr:hypothetical protein [Aquincola sp. J276]MCR5867034.1 hypothetical protein [Aquincola sp. J276]